MWGEEKRTTNEHLEHASEHLAASNKEEKCERRFEMHQWTVENMFEEVTAMRKELARRNLRENSNAFIKREARSRNRAKVSAPKRRTTKMESRRRTDL